MRIADLLDTGTVDDKAFNNFLGQLEEKIDGVTSWVECRAYGAADAIKEAALEYAGLAQKWWHFLRYTPRIAAASLLLAVAVGCAKQEVPKYIMPDSPKTYTIPNVNRVASEGEGIKVVFEESSIDVEMRYNTRESTRFFPFDGDPTPGVQQVPFPDPQSHFLLFFIVSSSTIFCSVKFKNQFQILFLKSFLMCFITLVVLWKINQCLPQQQGQNLRSNNIELLVIIVL